MNYIPLKKDDFDKSFRFEKQTYLCYSSKKIKEIAADKKPDIKGLARISNKDTESKLILGKKQMAVFDTDKDSIFYKNVDSFPSAKTSTSQFRIICSPSLWQWAR